MSKTFKPTLAGGVDAALSYGLARMYVDAHLSEWSKVPSLAPEAMLAVMDDYLASLAREPKRARAAIQAYRREQS